VKRLLLALLAVTAAASPQSPPEPAPPEPPVSTEPAAPARDDDAALKRVQERKTQIERELQRLAEKRRSGPHAENILRDLGIVAGRSH